MTANASSTISPSLPQQQPILRILLIGLLVVLSGYYIWVLYKAITPNVSLAYKTYYIKNQTLYWQPKQPNLALMLPTTLKTTTNIANLSRAGWSIDVSNNMRQLNQQGGLYFTLLTTPTTKVKITFNLAKAPLSLKSIPFTFNNHQGLLVSQNQGKHFVALLPTQQFASSARQLQSLILNVTTPLQVTSINLTPIDTNTSDTNTSILPHTTGLINQHIGNQQ
ncbi:riboflavin synthase subunit alpha [Photobacterium sp. S4TG1]|uniref:riboflavin synthase subunit alpha n=1 Tax=Photobacterium sp. S4TG1 TaxID=3114587 RepID=UPI002E17E7E7|nr:riboflavin synthase subunit alpha [Photobacterium sp. S4TG1]